MKRAMQQQEEILRGIFGNPELKKLRADGLRRTAAAGGHQIVGGSKAHPDWQCSCGVAGEGRGSKRRHIKQASDRYVIGD